MKPDDLAVILPAAGSGNRMESDVPKAYIKLNGKPILYWTIKQLYSILAEAQFILAVNPKHTILVEELVAMVKNDFSIVLTVVSGGNERQDSILNALQLIDKNRSYVAVHDAVRPFISKTVLTNMLKMVTEDMGVIPARRAWETVKMVKDESVVKTMDRNEIWLCQTPQLFHKDVLLKAYHIAEQKGYMATDDAGVVEMIGGSIAVVEGNVENIKITWPSDIIYAESLLNKWND